MLDEGGCSTSEMQASATASAESSAVGFGVALNAPLRPGSSHLVRVGVRVSVSVRGRGRGRVEVGVG